jgi:hypothetical protein
VGEQVTMVLFPSTTVRYVHVSWKEPCRWEALENADAAIWRKGMGGKAGGREGERE